MKYTAAFIGLFSTVLVWAVQQHYEHRDAEQRSQIDRLSGEVENMYRLVEQRLDHRVHVDGDSGIVQCAMFCEGHYDGMLYVYLTRQPHDGYKWSRTWPDGGSAGGIFVGDSGGGRVLPGDKTIVFRGGQWWIDFKNGNRTGPFKTEDEAHWDAMK